MMMEDEILIDNYLKGLLSKNEEKSFLKRLKSDAEFNENFKLEEQLSLALDDTSWSFAHKKNPEFNGYKELLEQDDLQNIKKTLEQTSSIFSSQNQKPNKYLFYYLAAASIVVLLGLQFFFNQSTSNQELYNEYVALNDLPSFVSRGNTSNKLSEAQVHFENKRYKEALVIFDSISNTQEQSGTLFIYKGLCETALGNFEKADGIFNRLIESNFLDAEKGFWYKALTYIKADKVEAAKTILAEIISRKLYNYSEAKELLEKIKD